MSFNTLTVIAGIFVCLLAWFVFFEGWNYVKGKLNIFHRFISQNPEYPEPEPEDKEPVQTKSRDKDVWKHWMKR